MAYHLTYRDLAGDAQGVKNTFSSWDSCMSKAYCKWPVIIGIVVASLIVLSIVTCFARCLCCGASFCCSFLSCCGCCDSCTRPRGRQRNSQFKDGYAPPGSGYQPMPSPMVYQTTAPQFATFDAPSGRIHEDSLPAMPSWDTAAKRRVEDDIHADEGLHTHGEDVEMGRLGQSQRGGYSQISNPPTSPVRPSYGDLDQPTEYVAAGYNPSLGPQRTGHQQGAPLRHQSYSSDFHRPSLSPAPTYATNPPEHQMATVPLTDRFAPGFTSPGPEQYNRNYTHSPPQQNNNLNRPYAPTISTRYEPSEYTRQEQWASPTQPLQQTHDYGNEPVNSNISPIHHQQPPSLLQVGRKPVNGTFREV